jgi:hypothetical protein
VSAPDLSTGALTKVERDATAATAELRRALDRVARALGEADLDRLLDAENGLELAVRRLMSLPRTMPDVDREALRLEIRAARQALDRCRALGGALLDVVRLSLDAQGRSPGYGRHQDAAAGYGARAINTTG